jgi:hypothetical protein
MAEHDIMLALIAIAVALAIPLVAVFGQVNGNQLVCDPLQEKSVR